MIEALTNLSHMQQSQADLHQEKNRVADLLRDVHHDILSLAEAKRHNLEFAVPSDLLVNVDRVRMNMALTNVFNNAVRFTPNGGSIYIRAVSHSSSEVWVQVKDSGIGIAKEQ